MAELPFTQEESKDMGSFPPPGDAELTMAPLPLKFRGARYLMAALLVTVIVTVVTSTYLRIEQQLRETREAQLKSVLEENVHDVSSWLESQVELAEGTATLPEILALATEGQSSSAPSGIEAQQKLLKGVDSLLRTRVVDRVEIRDPSGAVRVSTHPDIAAHGLAWRKRAEHDKPAARLHRVKNQLLVEATAPILRKGTPRA